MADPKKPDARDVQTAKQLVELQQANTIARLKNTTAIKAQNAALAQQGRVLAQQSGGVKKAGDAYNDLAEHADDAVEATDDAALASKRTSSAFEKLEKATTSATRAVDGMEAAWKIMIATHYDAIHAANMFGRAMQRELPKSARAVDASLARMTGRFADLREKSTKVATEFIIPWEEAVADQDKLLEAFGTNLDGASDAALDTLVNLQRSIYAIREATGVSFEDQVRNIDYAITHLGMTAEDYQTQIEALARAPSQIAPALDRSSAAAKRYKDILKTNGIIAAVNDMVRALDMENVSVKKLASSYGFLVEQGIKYGRTQRDTIAFAEKITKALYGVGDKTDFFQVGNFLGGEKLSQQLKASGLGGPNDAQARAGLRKKYLSDMGVDDESKATDNQLNRANAKIDQLQKALDQGDVNSGALYQFASSEDILKSKLAVAGDYQDLGRGDAAGLAGTQLLLEQILGADKVDAKDTQMFQDLVRKYGNDQEGLAQEFSAYLKQEGKGLSPDEIAAQEEVAKKRKLAESPKVLLDNKLGPDGYLIDALKDMVKSLSSIEGAIGFLAAASGYGASVGAGDIAAKNDQKTMQQVGQTAAIGNPNGPGGPTVDPSQIGGTQGVTEGSATALRFKIMHGTATAEELDQARKMAKQLRDQGTQQANQSWFEKGIKAFDPSNPLTGIDVALQATQGTTNEAGRENVTQANELDDALKEYDDKKGQPKIPGHAAGLNYVPFDDYLARLHEGERIMTKQQSKMLRDATMRAPTPTHTGQQAGRTDPSSGSQANQIPKGNLPMTVAVDGDKLTFTVQDAGPALMELLARSRPPSMA